MKKIISIILVAMMLFSVMTVSVSAATYSESESNDSYSTADTLNLNSSISGIMNNSNDVDIYKVTTSANGKLSFTFNHTHTDENNVIWWIYVYKYEDGKYNQLSRVQVNGYSDEKVDFPAIGAVSSGVYYVRVNTAYNNTTKHEYSLVCSFSSTNYYEKEMNDSYATATEITTNKEYKGYMNNSDDVDIYKITTSKSGKITFTFNHTHTDESNVIWWIYVYQYEDGKYNQLSRNQVNGYSDEKVEFPTIGTVPSGVYYVKVNTAYNNTTNHEYSITAKSSSSSKPTITLSDSKINVKVGESVTVVANCNKNGSDVRRTVNYSIKNTSVVSAEWIEWQGDDAYLKIHGVSEGTTTITITLTNTDTKEVYDTAEITVNVTEENKNSGNDNTSTSGEFSFMDILNAIAGFFTWLFSAIASLFA